MIVGLMCEFVVIFGFEVNVIVVDFDDVCILIGDVFVKFFDC